MSGAHHIMADDQQASKQRDAYVHMHLLGDDVHSLVEVAAPADFRLCQKFIYQANADVVAPAHLPGSDAE